MFGVVAILAFMTFHPYYLLSCFLAVPNDPYSLIRHCKRYNKSGVLSSWSYNHWLSHFKCDEKSLTAASGNAGPVNAKNAPVFTGKLTKHLIAQGPGALGLMEKALWPEPGKQERWTFGEGVGWTVSY